MQGSIVNCYAALLFPALGRLPVYKLLIPYNRQQLADYLNVDRSTMCKELSKMQKDGILAYERNRILLKT